jgi:hypothetical protein
MTSEARSREQRRADTMNRLEPDAELWVATIKQFRMVCATSCPQ